MSEVVAVDGERIGGRLQVDGRTRGVLPRVLVIGAGADQRERACKLARVGNDPHNNASSGMQPSGSIVSTISWQPTQISRTSWPSTTSTSVACSARSQRGQVIPFASRTS